ncbi:MAG: YdiU family protein [Verrucomicrobiae bacterium]|nr:YdiU family protein [Verrucomicrobiae bacterium]NNJ42632.1 YdiU family protein [Akkermansiaceae bacterium]
MPDIPFDNTYARLPERFFAKQDPARVPMPEGIRINASLAASLRIDPDWLASSEGIAMLAGNTIPIGAEPLAQAYAGHQFGGFSPQLGDGRALLLGEIIDTDGVRRDLQLKGSGRTLFSRGGDGKAALGPVLREYILSEAMHALGVPTTRALAAVTTGETILRQDGPLPGAVFTRVAASHLRVGTFQYFAAQQDREAVRELADYTIARHYPEVHNQNHATCPYLTLLKSVIQSQAELIAQWMSLGFIHGVMNTDNTAISGETIDYGPCAFMDAFHPQCVFSSIDQQARYAWGNQPSIALWNLTRFAETLLPLFDDNTERATDMAKSALSEFSDYFGQQYMTRFRAKFGLPVDAPETIIQRGLSLLADQQIDFTLFFRHLTRIAAGDSPETLSSMFTDKGPFETWFTQWRDASDPAKRLPSLRAANPILIPRNHRVEQAIQAAYAGDYAPFHRLTDALATPYSEQENEADLETPPTPDEIVTETFCGT